jgi:hypothetical protein
MMGEESKRRGTYGLYVAVNEGEGVHKLQTLNNLPQLVGDVSVC